MEVADYSAGFNDPFIDPYKIYSWATLLVSEYKYLIYVAIAAWLVIELLFWMVIHFSLIPKLQPLNPPLNYTGCSLDLVTKILDTMDSLDSYTFDKFVEGFFRGSKVSDLREDNIRSFLCWAMFGKREGTLTPDQSEKISAAYDMVITRYRLDIPKGFNPSVRHVAMTWEPISFIHRPLLLYVCSGLMQIITTTLIFRLRGFRSYSVKDMSYWYHPGTVGSSLDPVVFLHGITPGWLGYARLVLSVASGRPIFLLDLDGIRIKSMCFRMPNPENFSHVVKAIIRRHNYQTVSIVGHSFGTISAAWIIKHNPEIVSHVTLLDPVSLLLCLPDVAYAFVYRSPRTLIEFIIYFFAAKEITISTTLHRNFYWYRNVLWFDEIPAHVGVVVGIAGKDEVANPSALYEYSKNWQTKRAEAGSQLSKSANMEVIYWPEFSHGQVLLSASAQRTVVEKMTQNEKVKKAQ